MVDACRPSGPHRVRHYGFLNAHSRRSREELRLLISAAQGEIHDLADETAEEVIASPCLTCPACGGTMKHLGMEVRLPLVSRMEPNEIPVSGRAPP